MYIPPQKRAILAGDASDAAVHEISKTHGPHVKPTPGEAHHLAERERAEPLLSPCGGNPAGSRLAFKKGSGILDLTKKLAPSFWFAIFFWTSLPMIQ